MRVHSIFTNVQLNKKVTIKSKTRLSMFKQTDIFLKSCPVIKVDEGNAFVILESHKKEHKYNIGESKLILLHKKSRNKLGLRCAKVGSDYAS